jgi:acyl carrier protein
MERTRSGPMRHEATVHPADHEHLFARVRACIADVLNVNVRMISASVQLIELGADSFAFATVASRLDSTFNIALPPAYRIPDLHTVEAYVHAVAEQIGRNPNNVSRGGATES